MKLIGRTQGMGHIEVNAADDDLLQEAIDLARRDRIRYDSEKYVQDRKRFLEILATLFPDIKTTPSAFFRHNPYNGFLPLEDPLKPRQELVIATKFITELGDGSELRIIPEGINFFYMTHYWEHHKPDCVDDVVKMLGNSFQPRIMGAQVFDTIRDSPCYGIAEIPHFDKVIQLYERAKDLVHRSNGIIGINGIKLNTLRKDALEHENPAIRELSLRTYHQKLGELLLK